jgi:hypothetical protein
MEPTRPQDLIGHNCINLRLPTRGGLYAWEFERDGRELKVHVEGQLVFNGTFQMLNAALSGFGLAYVLEDVAHPILPRAASNGCSMIGARHIPATTSTTRAAGNRRRPSRCSSTHFATGRRGPLRIGDLTRAAEHQDLLGKWFLTHGTRERILDHFDRGLQCLEPSLAIASMRPLARMAKDVALDVLFDGGRPIRQAGVAQIGSRRVPVRIERFGRIGDLDDVAQPDRAFGRYFTGSLAVGVKRYVGK